MNRGKTITQTILDKIIMAINSNNYENIKCYENILSKNMIDFSLVPEIKIPARIVANIVDKFDSNGCDTLTCFEIYKNIIRKTNSYSKGETCILMNAIHCANIDFSFKQCIELLGLFSTSELCTKIALNYPSNIPKEFSLLLKEKDYEIKEIKHLLETNKLQSSLPTVIYKPKNFQPDIFDAIKSGNLENVQYLIEQYGINVESRDTSLNTPLLYSCKRGQISIVIYLITQANADITAINILGRNCFHMASEKAHIQLFHYLLNISPPSFHINLCDYDGNTPLHLASFYARDIHMVQFLLNNGANKFIINKFGHTAYDICGCGSKLDKFAIHDIQEILI